MSEKKWVPWQLAPDSDPEERFILVNADDDGEEHPNGKKYETVDAALADAGYVIRCFTFGTEHCRQFGYQFPAYVRIIGVSAEDCREEMFARYGRNWAFEYSEDQIAEQKKRFARLQEVQLRAIPQQAVSRG